MTGYPPADILGQHLSTLHPGAARQDFAEAHPQLEVGKSFAFESSAHRHDSSVFQAAWSITPIHDSDNQLTHYVIAMRDVTRQQEEAQAAESSHKLLQAVLDSMPANVAALDTDGRILHVNANWLRFGLENGLPPETDHLGWNYLAACDACGSGVAEAVKSAAGIRAVIAGEWDRFSLEYPCSNPADSDERWFLMSVTPLEEVAPRRVVVAHLNTTERKRAEADLPLQSAALDAAANGVVITDIAGTIEWGNPAFSALTGFTVNEARGGKTRTNWCVPACMTMSSTKRCGIPSWPGRCGRVNSSTAARMAACITKSRRLPRCLARMGRSSTLWASSRISPGASRPRPKFRR
jgi:PAS domain S-box-containing protein